MRGYLFDTNHVSAYFAQEESVLKKLRSLPFETLVRVSTVALGEIAAGHRITTTTNPSRRDEFTAFVNENFRHHALEISVNTGFYYATLMERIWERHPPHPKKRTEQHLADLGVDLNDVWAVATAWEHGLVFVTTDQMAVVREAAGDDVRFECWSE